jgi:two-component system KDP operon response regulator KdpE
MIQESGGVAAQVLVVEDDTPMRRFLRAALANEGYRVREAETGEAAITMIISNRPDLILLDLGLPDMDGTEILSRVREWSQVPIIVLSARGHEADKVDALNSGADDYLTKPFGVSELLARVTVALRHAAAARRVIVRGQDVHLTPIEYRLLTVFVKNAGKVLTHDQLLRQVWGLTGSAQSHYPRMYVASLRKKLEKDPADPRYLTTEQGVGYRLSEEPDPTGS